MSPSPTIAAVASPPGRSPRGLLRLSGPATPAVLDALLHDVPDTPRVMAVVRLREPALPAMLLRFREPRSYTGEDAAEIQVPGNAALLDRLLHRATLVPGVRLAEPGEFTFRAYTHGRLDLTQAEGIAATISATSDSQLRAATLLREGRLGQTASGIVEALGGLLALVEAGIDFTDQEDVVAIAPGELLNRLDALSAELDGVLRNSRPWGAVESLPRVVLVGPPSSGKSTLFNAMLGRERAVIDPLPGTTRDALEEPLRLTNTDGRDCEVMLIDIAGLDTALDDTRGIVDAAAQQAAREAVRRADLILQTQSADSVALPDLVCDAPVLRVVTRRDLASSGTAHPQSDIAVSAKTGEGLDTLRQLIVRQVGRLAVSVSGDLLTLQPRHEAGLRAAGVHLDTARAMLRQHTNPDTLPDIDLLADAIRAALDALAGLGGRLTPDEIIGRVFATFCIGK